MLIRDDSLKKSIWKICTNCLYQISGVQNETSSSNGGTRINTKVESEAEDDYDDTRHFVNSDLNNKAEVDSQDFEKDLRSKVKNKEITDATTINNSTVRKSSLVFSKLRTVKCVWCKIEVL